MEILLILIILTTTTLVKMTAGTCNSKQVEICRETDGKESVYTPTGQCQVQSYADGHYTHDCFVTHYKQGGNFCCCRHENNAMCCLYQQRWNHFRCNLKRDIIDTYPWKQDYSYTKSLILYISIPLTILVILGIILIVYLACKKKKGKCKCVDDNQSDVSSSDEDDYKIPTREKTPSPVLQQDLQESSISINYRTAAGTYGLLGYPLHSKNDEKFEKFSTDKAENHGLLPTAPPPPPIDHYLYRDNDHNNDEYKAEIFRGLQPPPLYEESCNHKPAPEF